MATSLLWQLYLAERLKCLTFEPTITVSWSGSTATSKYTHGIPVDMRAISWSEIKEISDTRGIHLRKQYWQYWFEQMVLSRVFLPSYLSKWKFWKKYKHFWRLKLSLSLPIFKFVGAVRSMKFRNSTLHFHIHF